MDRQAGALRARCIAPSAAQQAPQHHHQDAGHEGVRRQGEGAAGLPDPAQVGDREQPHEAERQCQLVRVQRRDRGRDVVHAGGHRHRDGEHVVGQQRAGREQPERPAQVLPRHLVGAAAARVLVHGLPVGGDDHRQQDHDPQGNGCGEVQQGDPTEAQHQQDLLGGVRHGRERVGGEDRQRDPLGQQLLRRPMAGVRTADQQPLGHRPEPRHDPTVGRYRFPVPLGDRILTGR